MHSLPLIGLLLFGLAARGAEVAALVSPKLKLVPACPALVAVAGRNSIPMEGIGTQSGTNTLRPGDSATVLVTFIQKQRQTQWLLQVEATSPEPAVEKPSVFTVNSSFGPPMKFESRPVPVKLRMLGPFGAAGFDKQPRMEESMAQFSLNEGFLGLGLDQAAALMYRWSQSTNFDGAVTSKALLAMNPTLDEQRAMCATFPALLSYFNIVQHTEGLEELLTKLIKSPSLWSLIRHGGVDANFSFGNRAAPSAADPRDWNLPASASVYCFPWLLRLNDRPALKITLVVTRPHPPLLICGGVVGLLAEPIGDAESFMVLRVISAQRKTARED